MTRFNWLFAALVSTLIAGCGFALRGSEALPAPLVNAYIDAPPNARRLAREIDRQLEVAGGTPAASAEGSSAVIRILSNVVDQRVVSVTPTGGPEQFEVFHLVTFEVQVDGERVFGPDDLTLVRDYVFNKNDVLGKRQEFDTLTGALRTDMANLILRRVSLSPDLP